MFDGDPMVGRLGRDNLEMSELDLDQVHRQLEEQ